ncbi:hypothetical protein AAEO50_07385 [Rossellomorea oryzaecorticis]|uniref:Uncharacterized protein n=1 Tax=Rossellomorea oryzaecorticis TaxID=1396505 RepID=A0ABU9K9D5_9BACI
MTRQIMQDMTWVFRVHKNELISGELDIELLASLFPFLEKNKSKDKFEMRFDGYQNLQQLYLSKEIKYLFQEFFISCPSFLFLLTERTLLLAYLCLKDNGSVRQLLNDSLEDYIVMNFCVPKKTNKKKKYRTDLRLKLKDAEQILHTSDFIDFQEVSKKRGEKNEFNKY